MFQQKHRGTGVLAGDGKALKQPQEHEQDRGGQADGLMPREEANGEGGKSHGGHGEHHDGLAPELVAHMS